MRLLLLAVLAAACGQAADAAPGGGCKQQITLAPASAGAPADGTFGPTTIDVAGQDVCLHLDGRKLSRAHLMIDTPDEPGTTTALSLRLLDDKGAKIIDGWDVTVGSPARTFENLEWSPPPSVVDVVLHVSAKTGTRSAATAQISFFDPLE